MSISKDLMSISRAARLMTAAVALAIGGLALPGNASAGFVVKDFSCTTTPLGVNVDVSGLGNTNLCVTGFATVDLSCACVGGGGNCPTDAKKQTIPTTTSSSQSFEPKNGRVVTTVTLPISLTDAACTAPQCGQGQTTKLIEFATRDAEPTFSVCTTTAAPGTSCTCEGAPTAGDLPETINCGPESKIVFPGKHDSCLSLFP